MSKSRNILIETVEHTFLCFPESEDNMVCERYDEPYLSRREIDDKEADDTYNITELKGSNKIIRHAGDEVIVRE